jgi:hypothetical protein
MRFALYSAEAGKPPARGATPQRVAGGAIIAINNKPAPAPHKRNLATDYNSAYTSPDALRDGEAHIASIKERLVQEGRL